MDTAQPAQTAKTTEATVAAQPAQLPVDAPGNAQLGNSAPDSYTGDDPFVLEAMSMGIPVKKAILLSGKPRIGGHQLW